MAICKGCGRYIVWGETLEGKRIPLDPTAACYAVNTMVEMGTNNEKVIAQLDRTCMVSHFSTCSKANLFSGKNKVKKGNS